MEEMLDKFVNAAKEALGDGLVSVILYGSKAGETDSEKKSDYNLLLILKNYHYELLSKLDSRTLKKWVRKGNPPPMIFVQEEFLKSADVFPIEFIDMVSNHNVLYGKDLLENIKIDVANLRHECEYELKAKLLRLRQQWLLNRRNRKALRNILAGTISSILVILKHVVKLSGDKMPEKKIDAPDILSKRCGVNPEIFKGIYAIKHGYADIRKFRPEEIFKEYLVQIEKVVSYLDSL